MVLTEQKFLLCLSKFCLISDFKYMVCAGLSQWLTSVNLGFVWFRELVWVVVLP